MVWYGVVWCGVVWCGVMWCGVVWCDVVLGGVMLCCVVLCCVVLCCVVLCVVVWCGVACRGVVWCGVVWCGMPWRGAGGSNYNSGVTGASGKKMWGYGSTPIQPGISLVPTRPFWSNLACRIISHRRPLTPSQSPAESKSFMDKVKTTINRVAEKIPDSLTGGGSGACCQACDIWQHDLRCIMGRHQRAESIPFPCSYPVRRDRDRDNGYSAMDREAEMASSFRSGGGAGLNTAEYSQESSYSQSSSFSRHSSSAPTSVGQSAFPFKSQQAASQSAVTT